MGGLTSKSCARKMVGEIYADDETVVEVTQKKEEETQKKESKTSLSDELLEVKEELQSMTDYVDRICAAASGPNGGANLVSGMIHACVQSILRQEIKELTKEMTRYRTLLSTKMRETPEDTLDLEATLKIDKLIDALGAGWLLLKQGESEEAVFEAFMTKLDIRLPEVVPESPKEEEPEKSSEEDVSAISLLIQCCVQSILQSDIRELALEMVEFRNILSKKMLATPREELDTFNLVKLTDGFEAGWQYFKHGCGENAAFEAFMTKMDVRKKKKDTTQ